MKVISRIRTSGEDVIIPMDRIGLVVTVIYADRAYEVIEDNTFETYRLREVTEAGAKQVVILSAQQLGDLFENNEIVEISN